MGGLEVISEKNIRQNDFEGKKFLQGKTWGKEFPTLKKYVWLIILEKNLTSPFFREKIYHQGFEEKIFLTKANHPYAPLKVKWSAP